ncbi:MAG: exo-alpha-sialidase [Pirellulales bacterium]
MPNSRRAFLQSSLVAGVSLLAVPMGVRRGRAVADEDNALAYRLSRDVPTKFFDGKRCWCHPRAGIVAGAGRDGRPRVVMTMNSLDLAGSDVFRGVFGLMTDDMGQTWSDVNELKPMAPREETIDGVRRPVAASDLTPGWHAASKSLLATGHSVVYTPEWRVVPQRPRQSVFASYDPAADDWSAWQKLPMPDATKFYNSGAGCTQRYDEADGTILLPFYFRPPESNSRVAVMRCGFDGHELKYLEHGSELGIDDETRGVGEPSLTRFGDDYLLTVRHDRRAYVARGRDGLHFGPLRAWTFDDGSELGSYNTQAHWVTHSDGVFLVYTRRGLNNDHVFRHRAPLVMAQVDPEELCVIRATEQVLVPERGARLGNFGVTDVTRDETWVTVAEWMQPVGCEKYGSDGSVYVARLHWKQPNTLVG